ncbi:LRR receptor serine/threonine-protein kinase FEI [Salix suchowensis]|nr:LRR receptor serine/threonine-protein kinase FEI [Salix suchowensis]
MWKRRNCYMLLKAVAHITIFFLITACSGGELSETEPRPQMRIVPHPCSYRWRGVKCKFQHPAVTQIRLDRQNFTGTIDADFLCRLQHLQVLSLAKNHTRGNIPRSILNCRSLTYLNLSNNLLTGRVPVALFKLKYLRTLDISNNYLTGIIPHSGLEFMHRNNFFMKHMINFVALNSTDAGSDVKHPADPPNGNKPGFGKKKWYNKAMYALCIVFLFVLAYFVSKKFSDLAKEREILKSLAHSPQRSTPPTVPQEDLKPRERSSGLVFFVEKKERLGLDGLFQATADLHNQTPKKFLIYKYQSSGSRLLHLLEGKLVLVTCRLELPWKLRLSIATSIARGLDFIRRNPIEHEIILSKQIIIDQHTITSHHQHIPHGNIKLSNILLDEDQEPPISEYGLSTILDPKRFWSFSSTGYTAPEKTLSEQGDVFSFGIIMLELLTGKLWRRVGLSKSPEEQPSMGEVMEKIEEVVNANDDFTISSVGSMLSSPPELFILQVQIIDHGIS